MSSQARTMKWGAIGDVMVVVHGARQPDPQEWSDYIADCDKLAETRGFRGLLAFANIALTAQQRADAGENLKKHKAELAAVITDSRLTRGMVTALGWFTGINRAYSPRDLEQALDDLRLSADQSRDVRELAQTFAKELGVEEAFFRTRRPLISL